VETERPVHVEPDGDRHYSVETIAACPACGGTDATDWVSGRDQLLKQSQEEFLYAHCNTCSAYFQKRRPTEGSISYFYQGDYGPYGKARRRRPRLWPLQKILLSIATRISGEHAAKQRFNEIYSRLTPDSVLLDFGCGSGKALDDRRARYGCHTIGIDFDHDLLAKVAARGHATYFADAAGWSHIPDASVDLVTMNHVIEHLYRPLEALTQIRRVLKPAGVLDIATPNPEGYAAQTFKSDWFGLDCPRHIVLYGPLSAARLLRRAGFGGVTVIANPVIKDVVRSKARARRETPATAIEADGWRALLSAPLIRREAAHDRYDQYHLVAKIPE
jgi:SAM-dependent methyltransferase